MTIARIKSAFLAAMAVLVFCTQPAFAQVDGPAGKAALAGVTNGKVSTIKYNIADRLLTADAKGYDPSVTVAGTVTETSATSTLTGLAYDGGKFFNDTANCTPVGGGKSPTAALRVRFNGGGFVCETDADALEFYANTGRYEIYIDGKPLAGSPFNTTVNNIYKKVDLGSSAPRRWEFRFNKATTTITGIAVRKTFSVWPASLTSIGPTVGCFGDSITEGPFYGNLLNPGDGWCNQLGRKANWNTISMGVGGTGYLAGSPNDAVTRIDTIADYPNMDMLIIAMGINDGGSTAAALTTAASATISRARALQPNMLIVVLGPWRGPGQAISQAQFDGIKAGFNAVADNRMLFVDTYAENWQYGIDTGIAGNKQSGNVVFTGALTAATSGTLNAVWPNATGSYTIVFDTGATKTATLTNNSTAVSWSGAITAGANAWGSTAASGNSGIYMVNDAIHPGVIGHTYLAQRVHDTVVKWLRTIVAEHGVVVGALDPANDNEPWVEPQVLAA